MLQLHAPAKLNLYLRVLGRRSDGYHELETLFERIDLADDLTFKPHPNTVQLTCSDPSLSCDEDNLIVKAVRALQRHCGMTRGVRIHLQKRIPIAAGLGGGSSDAATTLLGLNKLWDLRLERTALVPVAATLGSDVPFFLSEAPYAIGRGRGGQCEALQQPVQLNHVLVVPDATLSTKDIYESGDFNLTASKPSITIALHALRNGSLSELASGLLNDLAAEAIRRCPVIETIQSQLRECGCIASGVSGSGPSVFGLCQDLAQAQAVMTHLRSQADHAWRLEIVRTALSSQPRVPVVV